MEIESTSNSLLSESLYQPRELVSRARTTDFFVVAIGASAGGLDAINEFFDHLPSNTEAAFVIIQHLSPTHKSLMPELLTKHTTMPISEAREGLMLQPNSIYLIPNKNTLTIQQGKLRLAEKNQNPVPNLAIDTFLHSLATDKGSKSVAVILSGTGSDGTRGLEAIKSAGGIVVVQDPVTAHFDGMPNSAIATGLADAVLAPPQMATYLINYFENNSNLPGTLTDDTSLKSNSVLEAILEYAKDSCGLDFTSYKRPTLSRRVAKRMQEINFDSYDKYLAYLKETPSEIQHLCGDFLINVTRFFRDERAFALLEEKVIPELIRTKNKDEGIKIWVAGCSTGEEPYSLAMLVDTYLTKHKIYLPVKIFATDVDKEVIQIASRGIYPESITQVLPPPMLAKYFVRRSNDYIVCEPIRKMIIFAHHDVGKDAPFSKVDLISCRNMLIYMDGSLQHKVLQAFHFALNIGGFLFLGPSENLGALKHYFAEISRKWKIFKNLEASRKTLPQNIMVRQLQVDSRIPEPSKNKRNKQSIQQHIGDIFNSTLVEEYNYAGICIDENYRLLHAIGDYKKYLDLPDWQLQFSLTKMVPEDLAVTLGASIRKVAKTNQKAILRNVKLTRNGSSQIINIVIKPFLGGEYNERFLFVLFSEAILPKNQKARTQHISASNHHEQIIALEQELNETKENLYSTFEELEVSNEELQSNNEELLSANEELQSTNEELQSLNEELHTVNTEHQQKIKELIELNEDLDNYFRNADIGQMFVDQQLTIRKFTPAIINQINLIPSDIGRPLAHFSNNLLYNHFIEDIQTVIDTGNRIEKEIQIRNGSYYLMRLAPYLKQTNKLDGVVITFVDVTLLKNLNNTLQGILNSSINGIAALKAIRSSDNQIIDFEWSMANEAFGRLLKKDPMQFPGKSLLTEMPGMKKSRLFNRFVQVVNTGELLNFEHYYEYDELESWFHTVATKVEDGLTVTFADITEKKIAEQKLLSAYQELQSAEENLKKLNNQLEERIGARTRELSASEERFRLISLATNDVIWDWTMMNNKVWWNEGFKTMFDYTSEQIEPGVESWFDRIHPEDKDRIISSLNDAINSSQEQWSAEYRFRKADDSYAYVFNRAFIILNENRIPYRMLGSLIDLTNLKLAQEELRKTNVNLLRINNDLDNFVYTASHDLKSPISNIEGLLYHLELELENADDHILEILSHIKKSVDRFKATIKDLAEITKAEKLDADDVAEVNIEDLVEDIKLSINNLIEESDAVIEINCQECPTIKFSKTNLRSILYNLISNSIKYRDPDRPLLIRIATEKTKDHAILTVKDNGLGIEEAQQSKLFGMFKRFHNHVEGSGVGLYIVNKIVKNADGKIEVFSKPNQGTTFKILLKSELDS
ncbi:chemotaxis protein CheB [Adhaeribacter radiodurans]|uniref:PAS domain-containing protein n=1 Tax=Adhaeribacter radiodurans TaxID=2745197 RepID=A0A7L7L7Z1_9BACT|nr:chemotaxis protein CheB [Adhaeribacter radiodurans]QMU28917.1 PAS domain-containing protein [Adhaeribacter radiodurans]